MKFFAAVSVAATLVASVAAQVMLNTPAGVTQCLASQLTWTGGVPPYTLTVNPGGQAAALPLKDLGTQTGNSFSWTCDIAAGQSIFFRIRDSTGQLGETAAITILPGTSGVCLTASPVPASTPAGGAATPTPNNSGAGTGSTTAPGTGTTGAGTTAATAKPTGAAAHGISVSVVAGFAALGAALFA